MKRVALFAFAALLLMFPGAALEAGVQAMSVWATSFAPALFPFFVILPALTSPEARSLYEKLFGRMTRFLFALPGGAAAAIAVGWIAGSPAGALAVRQFAMSGGVKRSEARRAALMSVGVSPMFLMGAVGAGLLRSTDLGAVLVRSQLLASICSGLIFRWMWRKDEHILPASPPEEKAKQSPVREAALQMITVCGWMMLFGVIARLLTELVRLGPVQAPLLALLEVTGGCAAISQLAMPWTLKAILVSAACCFGGLCIIVQSLGPLKECGVSYRQLVPAKLLHALLGSAFCAAQLIAAPIQPAFSISFSHAKNTETVLLGACAMALLTYLGWKILSRAGRARML